MKTVSLRTIVLVAMAIALVPQHADAQRKRKSVYVDPGTITDNGNKYSDTDLRLLTQAMIESMINTAFEEEASAGSQKPIIAMGGLDNRTTQDIDSQLILDTIEVGILKSRRASFVNRSVAFKQNAAAEQALVQSLDGTSPSLERSLVGYQYLLEGSVSEIPSQDKRTRYYKLTLTLTDIRTSVKVWAEEHELKKRL
jgi:penicillin-binding protein activator